ncbi:MAG: energy transducer TonB [Neisseriaceae bacterium]|nr:energy transducer TonB [Neisseriaceae bacterium]
MKQETIFDVSVWIVVIVVHIAVLLAMWQVKTPQISSGAAVLEVVNLSGFKEAVPASAPVVAPKPVSKEPKKEILAVKKKDKKPDVVVKKTPPKVEKQPEPSKPIPQEEVAVKETPLAPVAEHTAENGTGSGTGKGASDNKGTGGENTHGQGGGGGATTAASHIGGHLHNPKPPYPQRSIENGEEGSVRLRVTVEANGNPSAVNLVKSSGYPALDRSALKTVREQYRFIPATKAGVAVRSDYTFSIKFELP